MSKSSVASPRRDAKLQASASISFLITLFHRSANAGSLVLHSEANNWSWVPVVGCLLGGVLGAFLYIALIEMHHTPDNDGETAYELQSIVTSKPEVCRMQGNGLGMGNMAFTEDGMGPNNNQGLGTNVTEKTSQL